VFTDRTAPPRRRYGEFLAARRVAHPFSGAFADDWTTPLRMPSMSRIDWSPMTASSATRTPRPPPAYGLRRQESDSAVKPRSITCSGPGRRWPGTDRSRPPCGGQESLSVSWRSGDQGSARRGRPGAGLETASPGKTHDALSQLSVFLPPIHGWQEPSRPVSTRLPPPRRTRRRTARRSLRPRATTITGRLRTTPQPPLARPSGYGSSRPLPHRIMPDYPGPCSRVIRCRTNGPELVQGTSPGSAAQDRTTSRLLDDRPVERALAGYRSVERALAGYRSALRRSQS
jgi:hypothetical protein